MIFFAKTKQHKNSPELSLLKFLPLTYHHSHFLAATLDFTSFFTIAFLRAALFFLQLGCFGLDMVYMDNDVNDHALSDMHKKATMVGLHFVL